MGLLTSTERDPFCSALEARRDLAVENRLSTLSCDAYGSTLQPQPQTRSDIMIAAR